MNYSKSMFSILIAMVVVCLAIPRAASAQRGGGGHAVARGGAVHGGATVGHAVARPSGGPYHGGPYYGPGRYYGASHYYGGYGYYHPYVVGYAPYYPYYYPYRPGFTVGFYLGFGYPYAYPYYPYPYGAYGYPLPPPGYVSAQPGYSYGGVRIQGAPLNAQVFADGYYIGVVDDFDGPTQHMNLQSGDHSIEIRPANQQPLTMQVNVRPGQTVTYHAGIVQ